MKIGYIIALLPLLVLTGCASNKLNKTVWYNVTLMQENGVMGNVGTSLIFENDSIVSVYKGVSIDTTVILKPTLFAYGKYKYEKVNGRNMNISLNATTRDGSPYTYIGTYNKKSGLMLLNVPDSKMKETYIWNPKAKVVLNK